MHNMKVSKNPFINVFSYRSYGLRKYKKGLIDNDKNTSNKNKT